MDQNRIYVVTILVKKVDVALTVPGMNVKREVPVGFEKGMIGILPVFAKKEDAQDYVRMMLFDSIELIPLHDLNGYIQSYVL